MSAGRHPQPCATTKARDRQIYRQQWFKARTRPAGSTEGDQARQWLEARAAALKAAHPPRQPYQKKARSRRAAKLQNRRLTAEEKARLHELRRIRYSVDDDFRQGVNAHNRAYYQRHREKILAMHFAYNSRPEIKAARTAKRHISNAGERAARRARRAARHATWAAAPMPRREDLKALPLAARRRVRQLWNYRKRVSASQP